jgi:hypothetical protein
MNTTTNNHDEAAVPPLPLFEHLLRRPMLQMHPAVAIKLIHHIRENGKTH